MITFITRTKAGHPLSAYEVFTTLAYLNIMRQTVILAVAIAFRVGSELRVGFHRFEEFLRLSETDPRVPLTASVVDKSDLGGDVDGIELKPMASAGSPKVVVQNLTCAWVPDRPVLHDVSLTLEPGALFCVAGPVGSGAVLLFKTFPLTCLAGKTTLLMALLGELAPVSGSVQYSGTMAYAAQEVCHPMS